MTVKFAGGKNIAMKVPPHQYEATVRFYRDLLGMEQISGPTGDAVGFKFGSNHLWIDKMPGMSQAELWLEIVTDDTAEAAKVLAAAGVVRCDEIEDLAKISMPFGSPAPPRSSTSSTQKTAPGADGSVWATGGRQTGAEEAVAKSNGKITRRWPQNAAPAACVSAASPGRAGNKTYPGSPTQMVRNGRSLGNKSRGWGNARPAGHDSAGYADAF